MPYNLLLLPLLGGFIFARRWNLLRFYALRSDGYLLLLYAALAGSIHLVAARFIIVILPVICQKSAALLNLIAMIDTGWHYLAPFQHSGVTSLAFALGAVLWWPLNKIPKYKEKPSIRKVLSAYGDPFVLLMERAMDQTKPVSLTLKGGKVYVGFVTYTAFTAHPAFPIRSIKILPFVSGYRHDETKRVRFTTDYSAITERIRRQSDAELENTFTGLVVEDFEITVPIDEIVSANLFNARVYKRHFRSPITVGADEARE